MIYNVDISPNHNHFEDSYSSTIERISKRQFKSEMFALINEFIQDDTNTQYFLSDIRKLKVNESSTYEGINHYVTVTRLQ